jgi:hypothetical protein
MELQWRHEWSGFRAVLLSFFSLEAERMFDTTSCWY